MTYFQLKYVLHLLLLHLFFTLWNPVEVLGQDLPFTSSTPFPKTELLEQSKQVVCNGKPFLLTWSSDASKVFTKDQGRWELVPRSDTTLPEGLIQDITVNSNDLYFATDKGLIRFNITSQSWHPLPTENRPTNVNIRVGLNGKHIAVLTDKGLSYKSLRKSLWNNIPYEELKTTELIGKKARIMEVHGDRILWCSYDGLTVFNMTSYNFKNYSTIRHAKFVGNTIIGLNDANRPVFIDDTLLQSQGSICNLRSSFGETPMHAPFIVDRNGNPWILYRNTDTTISLATPVDGILKLIRVMIPIHSNPVSSHPLLITYDNFSDSLYTSTGRSYCLEDIRQRIHPQVSNFGVLEINDIRAPFFNNGDLFWDGMYHGETFKAPKNQCTAPIFAGGLWMGGYDDTLGLHISAMNPYTSQTDYSPGPLDIHTGEYDTSKRSEDDRVWTVYRSDVVRHVNLFNKNGTVAKWQTAEAIWNWPGNGTGNRSAQLAPFIDLNGNKLYEPQLGEYPDVPGDECIYWIMNDNAEPNTNSNGLPTGFEIHCMAYAYHCSKYEANTLIKGINNSIFYKYTIINRNTSDYRDVIVGHWLDPDIGSNQDDYFGTHVIQNMVYTYNSDAHDESEFGYGSRPPMVGLVMLNAPKFIHDGADGDGDGTIDEQDERIYLGGSMKFYRDFSDYGKPTKPQEYYNYLNNRWKRGKPLTYGQDGSSGTDTTSYLFPGNTDFKFPQRSWTPQSEDIRPHDVHFVANSFPFDLLRGDTATIEYALIYARDLSADDQLPNTVSMVKTIKNWYYSDGRPPCSIGSDIELLENSDKHIHISPNPTHNHLNIISKHPIERIDIFDLSGRVLGSSDVPNQNSTTLFLERYTPGMFIIQVHTKQDTHSERILKY